MKDARKEETQMEYKLLSEVSVYRKDRIGSDKVNKENYIFCYLILDLTSKKYGMQLKKVAVPMMYWL